MTESEELPMSCPFCSVESLDVVATSVEAVAVRDRYPVTDGHHLVVPRRHVTTLLECSDAELHAVWQLVRKLTDTLTADGFTIGHNAGVAAGQTIGHAHLHVIPRRTGDVPDPRGGVRWVLPAAAPYWREVGGDVPPS
jgi:diadenosine tetraphosphate (Ap4A) HIT family hydrolase